MAKADVASVAAVLEFAPLEQKNAVKEHLKAIPESQEPLEVEYDAQAMVDALDKSGKSCSSSALIIALPDPIGITADLNHYRNFYAADLLGKSSFDNQEKNGKAILANTVNAILEQVDKAAKDDSIFGHFYDRGRFEKHLNLKKLQVSLEDYDLLNIKRKYIVKISSDYSEWLISPEWKSSQAQEFDDKNENSDQNHQEWILQCIIGSGETEKEQKAWLDCINRNVKPEENWLLRLLFGLDTELIANVNDLRSKVSISNVIEENQKTIVEFSDKVYQAMADIFASANALRGRVRAHRDVLGLIVSVEKQLAWLYRTNPKAYVNVVGDVAVSLMGTGNYNIEPYRYLGTADQIEIVLRSGGDPGIKPHTPISAVNDREIYRCRPGYMAEYDAKLSQKVGRDVIYNPPVGKGQRLQFAAFLVTESYAHNDGFDGMKASYRQMLNLDTVGPSPDPQINAWGNIISKGKAAGGAAFNGIINFFLIVSSFSAMESLRSDKTTDPEKAKQTMVLFSNALAFAAGTINIKIAIEEFRGIANPSRAAFSAAATKFNMVSSLITVALINNDVNEKLDRDDLDSACWSMLELFCVVAGIWVGIAAAEASGVVPGVGWALAGLILIVIGAYAAIAAYATNDLERLDLEYWLDNGSFGLRNLTKGKYLLRNPFRSKGKGESNYTVKEFTGFDEEMRALYLILFTPSVRSSLNSRSGGSDWGYSTTIYENDYVIKVPSYRDNTKVSVRLGFISSKDEEDVLVEYSLDNGTEEIKMITQSTKLLASATPKISIDKDKSFLTVSGRVSLMSDVGSKLDVSASKLTVGYYPMVDSSPDVDVGIVMKKELDSEQLSYD
ncbi:hypothetical protein GLGR_3563 [Leminorella grimontii ATCC 33999 = DSM 5078]|nr:hypothetical protein GLGR_3563 [Leminorella grimontii ATCC 33999 = DSM 5078]